MSVFVDDGSRSWPLLPTPSQVIQLISSWGPDKAWEYVSTQQELYRVSVLRSFPTDKGQFDSFDSPYESVGTVPPSLPLYASKSVKSSSLLNVTRGYCYAYAFKPNCRYASITSLKAWPFIDKLLRRPLQDFVDLDQMHSLYVRYSPDNDELHVGTEVTDLSLVSVFGTLSRNGDYSTNSLAASFSEFLPVTLPEGMTLRTKVGGQTKMSDTASVVSLDAISMFNLSLNTLVGVISPVWSKSVSDLVNVIIMKLHQFRLEAVTGSPLYISVGLDSKDMLMQLYLLGPSVSHTEMYNFLSNLLSSIDEAIRTITYSKTRSEFFVSSGLVFVTQVPGPTLGLTSTFYQMQCVDDIYTPFKFSSSYTFPLSADYSWLFDRSQNTLNLVDVVKTLRVHFCWHKDIQNAVAWIQGFCIFHPTVSSGSWIPYCSQRLSNFLSHLSFNRSFASSHDVLEVLKFLVYTIQESVKHTVFATDDQNTVLSDSLIVFMRGSGSRHICPIYSTSTLEKKRVVFPNAIPVSSVVNAMHAARNNIDIYRDIWKDKFDS